MKQHLLILIFLITSTLLTAKDITVSPEKAPRTLTAALMQATDGDRILVQPGLYQEGEIIISKSVTIIGKDFPVFDGESEHQVFTVEADSVVIRGLVIKDCGASFIDDKAGIKVLETKGCVIEGNRLEGNFFGIYLAKSQGTRVLNNDIRSNATSEAASGNGIHLWYCKDADIHDNRIQGHRDGIYFEFVQDGKISGNFSTENLRYGLHFMFSDRCEYRENSFINNGAGVAVMYTKNVLMINNRFADNWGSAAFGLLLKDITDSEISGNSFSRNSIGIFAENSGRMTVEKNDFNDNGWAVKIMANCMENVFQENNFLNNSFDVATNSRNNFNRFERNYWSAYQGYDLDRDGYGDVPFRPVRLFSLIVEQNSTALVLQRSLFIDVLDMAERVLPILTPETLIDEQPALRRIPRSSGDVTAGK